MKDLNEAIDILSSGGIVIFPTDTAFGVGCRIDRPKAIERLFDIRKRPFNKPTPILVDSYKMAKKYWSTPLPDIVRHLSDHYWPGGLTIIAPANLDKTPLLARGNGTNIGLRMPDHEVSLALIKGVGVPILGPSANFHGQKTPYQFSDLDPEFLKLVDFVLSGECKTKLSSTVVDCTVRPIKIIRQGAVKLDI